MTPSPASPASMENIARPMTTTPDVFKNSEAYLLLANVLAPKDSKDNAGKVPKAKKSIINEPEMNEPLLMAEICIA